ncbi:hypothetical protein RB195_005146 [Necator americanus]|uniref:C2H2-type domain-containing protein n=1 Tax=Necator americanus TaxID=51031 RepID=A0ABR1BN82_NECAM
MRGRTIAPLDNWEDYYVQINIYNTNLRKLREEGVDIEDMLNHIGYRSVVMNVPIMPNFSKDPVINTNCAESFVAPEEQPYCCSSVKENAGAILRSEPKSLAADDASLPGDKNCDVQSIDWTIDKTLFTDCLADTDIESILSPPQEKQSVELSVLCSREIHQRSSVEESLRVGLFEHIRQPPEHIDDRNGCNAFDDEQSLIGSDPQRNTSLEPLEPIHIISAARSLQQNKNVSSPSKDIRRPEPTILRRQDADICDNMLNRDECNSKEDNAGAVATPPSSRGCKRRRPAKSKDLSPAEDELKEDGLHQCSSGKTPTPKQTCKDRFFECQIAGCGSRLVLRKGYSKNRLIDHVRIHWGKLVKRCKLCDYTATHVRKIYCHHKYSHKGTAFEGAISMETMDDLKELLDLWKYCFPAWWNCAMVQCHGSQNGPFYRDSAWF